MLSQDNYKRLLIERRTDGVAIVTLNRPEKMNAIDNQMHHELMTFSRDFQNDPEMRALVLAGQGRAFCAGGIFLLTRPLSFHQQMKLIELSIIFSCATSQLSRLFRVMHSAWAPMSPSYAMWSSPALRPNLAIHMSKWGSAQGMAVN